MIIPLLRKTKRKIWSLFASWMKLTYKLPSGVSISVDSYSDWCTIGDIFINGEYDHAIDFSLLKSDKIKPFVFLDLGANVGYFTQRVLHRATWFEVPISNFKGLLVEATPSLRPELESRLKSWINLGVVLSIVTAAAGKKAGFAVMNEGTAHSRNFLSFESSKGGWNVPFIDLEANEICKGFIDLIKCDIEGSETLFLEEYGELLKRCKVFVIECHLPVCTETMVADRLASLGFEFKGRLRTDPEGITVWFSNSNLNF